MVGTYSYGGLAKNTKMPQYQFDPRLRDQWDWVDQNINGPSGWQTTVNQVQNTANNVTPFASKLPWNDSQIGTWITNNLTGKGAAQRGRAYGRLAMGDVNRTFDTARNNLSQTTAESGGQGSSEAAAMNAGLVRGQAEATAGVSENQMAYEDALRQQYLQNGMGGLSQWQNINQADTTNSLNAANLNLASLQPGMNVWGTGLQTKLAEADQIAAAKARENAFNQWMYNTIMTPTAGQQARNQAKQSVLDAALDIGKGAAEYAGYGMTPR